MSLASTPDGAGAAAASREAKAAQYRELAAAALAQAERAELEGVRVKHRGSAARWLVLALSEERLSARRGPKAGGDAAPSGDVSAAPDASV